MEHKMSGSYKSELAAKRGHCNDGNCIVRFDDGTWDWFPQGHPIGEFVNNERGRQFVKATNCEIIARARKTVSGNIVWR